MVVVILWVSSNSHLENDGKQFANAHIEITRISIIKG